MAKKKTPKKVASLQKDKSSSASAEESRDDIPSSTTMNGEKTNGRQRSKDESSSKQSSSSVDVPNDNNDNSSLPNNNNNNNNNNNQKNSFVPNLLRSILVDFPLLLVFAGFLSILVFHKVHDEYLLPQMDLMKITPERQNKEVTYYHRDCDVQDLSATDTRQLIVPDNTTAHDAMNHMLKHGMQVYPKILSDDTADKFRDFVIDRNTKEEAFWVIEGENRWSFGIKPDQDPIVSQAFKEIATHPTLRPALEKIIGENPALIECTAITSGFGAADQFWHADVLPHVSSTTMARSFVPSYSLFIPLQDTTAEMGATELCPGSHICGGVPPHCHEHAFQVSGKQNLWPKGSGALLNQGVFHRGTANNAKGAPHRAVLILTFAPRPRFGKDQVETRQISQGGSYSLRWDMWGHTMDDLAEADTVMMNPWLTLRSLGLYKPSGRDWGWDFLTQASMRITNDDNGYHYFNLEDFIKKGGFRLLPDFLHGNSREEEVEGNGWYDFLFDTMLRCEEFVQAAYMDALKVYILLVAFFSVAAWVFTQRTIGQGSRIFARALRRLIITHIVVALIAGLAFFQISQTQWAKNIKSKELYQLPALHHSNDSMRIPGSLPSKTDVLISTRLSSDYLGSYQHISDVAHPGNKIWKELVGRFGHSYVHLSSVLQNEIIDEISNAVHTIGGRFMMQNDVGDWYEIPAGVAKRVNHRALAMEGNEMLRELNSKIEQLISESKFGQRTADQHIAPVFWEGVQAIMFQLDHRQKVKSKADNLRIFLSVYQLHALRKEIETNDPSSPVSYRERYHNYYQVSKYLKEGDLVDGKYNGKFNEWYKATIIDINPHTGKYDIEYFDGDEDLGLEPGHVRPFRPYAVGELLQYRNGRDVYVWCTVVAANANGSLFSIEDSNGVIHRDLSSTDLRRIDQEIAEGAHIQAKFYGEGTKWYPGKISRINEDGTFDIDFDDGDRELGVERENIRFSGDTETESF